MLGVYEDEKPHFTVYYKENVEAFGINIINNCIYAG